MSMMNMELYDALISVNVPETKAREAAMSILGQDQVATKADMAEIKGDIHVLKWIGRRKHGDDSGPDMACHGVTGLFQPINPR